MSAAILEFPTRSIKRRQPPRLPPKPPITIGKLIDLADELPPEKIIDQINTNAVAAWHHAKAGHDDRVVELLILLGALATREVFIIRGVPKDRDHVIVQ